MGTMGKGSRCKGCQNNGRDSVIHADSGTGSHGYKLGKCGISIGSSGTNLIIYINKRITRSCTDATIKTKEEDRQ